MQHLHSAIPDVHVTLEDVIAENDRVAVRHLARQIQRSAVGAEQAIVTRAGEWVQYCTPQPEGAEYVAVCLPAFSAQTMHRDD